MVRRPKIDAGWTWPGPVTLSGPIGATLEVVGESHYQAELMRVGGGGCDAFGLGGCLEGQEQGRG